MVELVATHGYEAVTVRGLTKRARVSSGTFYNHYRSTDDCLLSTFDLICRSTSERLLQAGQEEPDPRRRLALAIGCLFRDMAANRQAATFMLRGAPAAGPAFTSRLRNSAMRIGLALEFCLRTGGGPHLPPHLLEGVVAGLARIGRLWLPAATEAEIGEIAAEAAEWIMSLSFPSAQGAELLVAPVPPGRRDGSTAARRLRDGNWQGTLGDERVMILAAAFRIAQCTGYHQLSIPMICREAGVSRRSFNRHFEGLEDCFSAALEERVASAVEASLRRRTPSAPWSTAVCEALEELCDAIEADVDSARVLLVEVSAAGTAGIDSRERQIARIARALQATAPVGREPSELAAEASTAAAWAILRRRASEQSSAATASLLPLLAFLALAPAVGSPAALRAITASRGGQERIKKRNV
ncbi:MAG TPA: TetR/AcrR family transcriptional regulator [Solirubrobacterales bacterium]|nr:TetR/AcrR family transcriptional regulator [Solirubrobacterales bacterium]